jgi:hypothetical protein
VVVVMKNRIKIVASCADEAIDLAAMDAEKTLKEWLQTREPSIERTVEGATVTRFHLAPIRQSVLDKYVHAAGNEYDLNRRAFQCGVSKIENLVSAETWETIPIFEPKGKIAASAGDVPMFSDKQLEHVSGGYKQDIGAICLARSFLAHASDPPSQVPLYLLSQIALLISRSAADRQDEQTTQTTSESSD